MRTLEYTENILIVKLEYLIFRTEDSFQESVCYSGPNCVNFTQIPPIMIQTKTGICFTLLPGEQELSGPDSKSSLKQSPIQAAAAKCSV